MESEEEEVENKKANIKVKELDTLDKKEGTQNLKNKRMKC